MAIARVQYTDGGNPTPATPATPVTTSAFGSSLTVGNWIVAFARWANVDKNITDFSDSAGNTYTQRALHTASDPRLAVYTAPITTGGASRTVSYTLDSGGSSYQFLVAIEFSGVASFGAAGTNPDQSATTDLVSTAITTSTAGTAVVMAASQPAFVTFSAGTNFTLIDGTLGTGGNIGGAEDYIPAGTLSSYVAHITSDTSALGSTIWATLVPTVAAGEDLGYQRLYGPTHLGTSAADLYTVPAGLRTRIRHIYVNNPTGPAVDFTLSVGNDAAATRLYDSYNIPAEGSLEWAYDHALAAGEKIQAYAGLGSQLVLEIDGYVEAV